jgi:molybdopterin converting factor subunit 1
MKLHIQLFAAAREAIGNDRVIVEVGPNTTVAEMREALHEQCEPLRALLPHALIAINSEYASPEHKLGAGDEIALIPPVSGG